MSRLDRYILAQLLWVFGFLSFVMVGVALLGYAMEILDRMMGDGQSLFVFMEFALLSMPARMRDVLLIAAFVASVRVSYTLLGNNELAAAQAAGISPLRLARPVLYFGVLVAAFLSLLSHVLIPAAQAQRAALSAEIAQNISRGLLTPGVFQQPVRGLTVFVSEITTEGTLTGVFISDRRSSSEQIDYTASRALIVPGQTGPTLVMIDGFAQVLDNRSGRLFTTTFDDFTYDLGALTGQGTLRRDLRELSTRELLAPTDALRAETRASPAMFDHELIFRFSAPMLSVAVVLMGYALLIAAPFNRMGFWRPVVAAAVLMAAIAGLTNAIAGQVMRGQVSAWTMMIPPVLSLGIVFAMLLWAGRRRRQRMMAPAVGAPS